MLFSSKNLKFSQICFNFVAYVNILHSRPLLLASIFTKTLFWNKILQGFTEVSTILKFMWKMGPYGPLILSCSLRSDLPSMRGRVSNQSVHTMYIYLHWVWYLSFKIDSSILICTSIMFIIESLLSRIWGCFRLSEDREWSVN